MYANEPVIVFFDCYFSIFGPPQHVICILIMILCLVGPSHRVQYSITLNSTNKGSKSGGTTAKG